jgi:hypothetical protein
MPPASAGATAAKVLVCFFVLCYLLNSPLGGEKKKGADRIILAGARNLLPVVWVVCGVGAVQDNGTQPGKPVISELRQA